MMVIINVILEKVKTRHILSISDIFVEEWALARPTKGPMCRN